MFRHCLRPPPRSKLGIGSSFPWGDPGGQPAKGDPGGHRAGDEDPGGHRAGDEDPGGQPAKGDPGGHKGRE